MPLQVKKAQLKVKDGNEYIDGDLLFNVDAEAWARGTRNGQDVIDGDPTFHNNAKYYVDSSIDTINDTKIAAINAVNAAGTAAVANFPVTADACDTLAADFAAAFVPNQAYSVGDYCTYQYKLYQCKTAIAENADASFVAAHWNQITVTDTLTNQVGDLKNALDDIKAVTVTETEEPESHVLNNLSWTDGYCRNDGVVASSETLHYTEKIPVETGDKIVYVVDVQGDTTWTIRYITAYNDNTVDSAKGAESSSETKLREYTVPSGINYIVLTCYKTYAANETITLIHNEVVYNNILTSEIEKISDRLDDISIESEYNEEHTDSIGNINWTAGYVTTSGTVSQSQNLKYSDKKQVAPGDIIILTGADAYFRFITAYSGNDAVSEKGINSSSDGMTNMYVVPDEINGIIITLANAWTENTITKTFYTEETATNLITTKLGYMSSTDDLSDGDYLDLPYHNVKNNNIYIFNANVSIFDKIIFTKGGATLTIDDTNITIGTTEIPHGITITHDISLRIENETSTNLSKISLESAGEEFVYTTPVRLILDGNDSGAITRIASDGSSLTECTFSWVSRNINKPIWMFGDSYFSWYDDRWTYYLARDGYCENCILNAYAGQKSNTAYMALTNLLQITTPKMVVWCMGMNDIDTDGTVNASWKLYYDKLLNLKNKYGFELILYTVPTTPTRNNTYKDAIIRSSGYRYIEADLALRINDNGEWVDGALADNVHPTIKGAKILYYRILADLPEIACV